MKWLENEEKDLINLVSKCKEHELLLKEAFVGHAKKYNRSVTAVKKHYYSLCPKGNKETLKNALLEFVKEGRVINIDSYKKPIITEKDLEALFRGLVRLIQTSYERD